MLKSNLQNVQKKVWKQEEIRHLLQTDDRMVIRSLLKLYDYQTEEEKAFCHVSEMNGVGFNKFDADVLTRFVVDYYRYGGLTIEQIEISRRKLLKYSKQLTKIANGEI